MTQLKDGGRQPSNREERPLSASTVIARGQGNGEPCKSRGLRTVLWAAGGEIPPADPAPDARGGDGGGVRAGRFRDPRRDRCPDRSRTHRAPVSRGRPGSRGGGDPPDRRGARLAGAAGRGGESGS